jgi:hypothetical protein
MKASKVIEFKRMLRQYEYGLEDLSDLKELNRDVNSEFSSALAALERHDLFENKKIEQAAEEAEVEEIIPEERDPAFKKLFRKIVVLCHPDKFTDDLTELQKAFKKDMYDRAVKANDQYKWAEMITVAIKLEIDLPEEYYEYVENLKADADKVQQEIESIQGSVAWTWYHAPDEQKPFIMAQYVKHMEKMVFGEKKKIYNVLGVGHPRTGTGYTTKLLKSWGLNVGHEVLEDDGIVAWQLVISQGPWPYMEKYGDNLNADFKVKIYCVRDPRQSLPSIVYTENTNKISFDYRASKTGRALIGNQLENAIKLLLAWDQKIMDEINPNIVYRIEHDSKMLYDRLVESGLQLTEHVELNERVNSRNHKSFEEMIEEFPNIAKSTIDGINDYCQRYGYAKLFD